MGTAEQGALGRGVRDVREGDAAASAEELTVGPAPAEGARRRGRRGDAERIAGIGGAAREEGGEGERGDGLRRGHGQWAYIPSWEGLRSPGGTGAHCARVTSLRSPR